MLLVFMLLFLLISPLHTDATQGCYCVDSVVGDRRVIDLSTAPGYQERFSSYYPGYVEYITMPGFPDPEFPPRRLGNFSTVPYIQNLVGHLDPGYGYSTFIQEWSIEASVLETESPPNRFRNSIHESRDAFPIWTGEAILPPRPEPESPFPGVTCKEWVQMMQTNEQFHSKHSNRVESAGPIVTEENHADGQTTWRVCTSGECMPLGIDEGFEFEASLVLVSL